MEEDKGYIHILVLKINKNKAATQCPDLRRQYFYIMSVYESSSTWQQFSFRSQIAVKLMQFNEAFNLRINNYFQTNECWANQTDINEMKWRW